MSNGHPCVPCKQLLDGGAALQRAIGCMGNTLNVYIGHGGHEPDAELVAKFMDQANELAMLAAEIEKQVSGK